MDQRVDYFTSKADQDNALANPARGLPSNGATAHEAQSKVTTVQKADRRVCDRCIVKKVKCDMKQPSCSRCTEAESLCIYSVRKRKPGPAKGSKHARRRTSKDTHTSITTGISEASSPASRRGSEAEGLRINAWQANQTMQQNTVQIASNLMSPPSLDMTSVPFQSINPSTGTHDIPTPLGIPPSLDQQQILLENFFLHIHPSIPLFQQQRFMLRYDTNSISEHLLLTICVITAKTLGMSSTWNGSSLEDCIAYLLDLKTIQNEGAGKPLSLDNFRQACLIAFYAFHQYPSDRSWMRIGNLTRKAYQCGLHQIDFPIAGSAFDRENVTLEELDEWRYVWWCIYCLDTYSNVSAVTPFVIEVESVKTALVSSSLTENNIEDSTPQPLKYLPDDTDVLWKTVKEITASSKQINYNMHILTTTLIREAATVHRLRKQSTSKRIRTRLTELEDHFSAFRLALPARYLNASRNAFVDESGAEHHARLICVLHIYLARILTYFPFDPQIEETKWMVRWQQCLECAEDIVSIVKQWDSQYFAATDPAICMIILTAMTMLHLHGCGEDATSEFKVRMDTQADVLTLFLEQFASAWSLPRFLIISFQQFKKIVTGPLTPLEIDRILIVSAGPLNYRWLNFLSLSSEFENMESPGRMYENLFNQEWDANEWEALLPMAQAQPL